MLSLIFRRALQAALALLVLSLVVFSLSRVSGDPVEMMLPIDATMEDRAMLRETLGLDQPVVKQYWTFLVGAVQGDFGISIRERRPVAPLIMDRLVNSAYLAATSMLVALSLALPLAIASAVWKGTLIDSTARLIAVMGQTVPTFLVGSILIIFVAGQLRLLPAGGMSDWTSYILPSFTLGWFVVAGMMRLLRSSLLDVLDSEFVKLARVKGVPEWRVVMKHALRNALIPVLTFGGMYFALMISTAVVVETVFSWPGIGRLAYDAVRFRDFPVTQGVVLVTAVLVVVTNLVIDILYAWIDPRIRLPQGGA